MTIFSLEGMGGFQMNVWSQGNTGRKAWSKPGARELDMDTSIIGIGDEMEEFE